MKKVYRVYIIKSVQANVVNDNRYADTPYRDVSVNVLEDPFLLLNGGETNGNDFDSYEEAEEAIRQNINIINNYSYTIIPVYQLC